MALFFRSFFRRVFLWPLRTMLSVPELTTCSTSFFGEPWEGPCWNLAVVGILGGFVWALLHLGLSLTVFTWATGRAPMRLKGDGA